MYKLPVLPFLYQDLEPFIDTHTMGLHYNKHEQTYLNNLNDILEKNNYDYRYDLTELIYHLNEFLPDDMESLIFNLGGVLNHNLYWLSINSSNYLPSGKLLDKINNQYGSYDKFFDLFKKSAMNLKGSGYTFLVMNSDGNLDIVNMANQDSPLLYNLIPLFNIDLWEHAYYLNYQNDKSRYIDNFKLKADFRNASFIYNSMAYNP